MASYRFRYRAPGEDAAVLGRVVAESHEQAATQVLSAERVDGARVEVCPSQGQRFGPNSSALTYRWTGGRAVADYANPHVF